MDHDQSTLVRSSRRSTSLVELWTGKSLGRIPECFFGFASMFQKNHLPIVGVVLEQETCQIGRSWENRLRKTRRLKKESAIPPRQIIPECPYNMHKVHLQQTTESILEENQPSTSNKLTPQFRQAIILNHPISKTYPARKTKVPMNIHTKIWPSAMANRSIFFCTQLTTQGRARKIFRQFLAFVPLQYSVQGGTTCQPHMFLAKSRFWRMDIQTTLRATYYCGSHIISSWHFMAGIFPQNVYTPKRKHATILRKYSESVPTLPLFVDIQQRKTY